MKDRYFLDTNILIYSFDKTNPSKQAIAKGLINKSLKTGLGCISYQVMQEFLNASTRKFVKPLSINEANEYLSKVMNPLCEVFPTIELYSKSLEIMERWKYSFYDSLIITAAIQAGCKTIFTEDLQDGQQIQSVTISNPF